MATERSIGPEDNLLEPGADAAHQLALPSPVLSQLRAGADPGARRRAGLARLPDDHPADPVQGGRQRRGPPPGDRGPPPSGRPRRSRRATTRSSCPTAATTRSTRPSRRSSPCRPSTTTWSAPAPAAGSGLVLESGEPREAHHFCLLIGYGASAINPYLAFETIDDQVRLGIIPGPTAEAEKRYRKAVVKGVIKAISPDGHLHGPQLPRRAGVRGARPQPRLRGRVLHVDAQPHRRHRHRDRGARRSSCGRTARTRRSGRSSTASWAPGGQYKWRADGEHHLFNPLTIHTLQKAVRTGDYGDVQGLHEPGGRPVRRASRPCAGCSSCSPALRPVPIDEVEPVESIVRRFKTGAMSYGSISGEAHEALAIAMNRLGGKSNTGEGGEDPARYEPMANGDSKNSAIKQVASGRFGVTSASTWSTPASSRSRWPRAPSPARAASCRAPRSTRGSRRPATPRPASG